MSCVDASGLSSIHRDQIRWILTPKHELSSVSNLQLSTEITEVGKLIQHRGSKRKRADDDEYLPGSVRRAPSSAKRRYSGACRAAVQQTIATFKTRYFREHVDAQGHVSCEVSGLPVSIDDAHVDHAPPNTFDTIVQDFLSICATKNGTTLAHVLSHTEYVAGRFFDHNECAAFVEYHTANASLRILTARTNLSLPRKRQC